MFVQPQRSALRIRVGLAAKDLAALGVKHTFGNEFLQGLAGREGRIELDQRFGPEHFIVELTIYESAEIGIEDVEEAASVLCVVRNDFVAEIEDVHRRLLPSAVRLLGSEGIGAAPTPGTIDMG